MRNVAGRDGKRLFVVIRCDEKFVYLADGRHRFLDAPKRKNKKHINPTGLICDLKGISTDKGLRRFLRDVDAQQTI